MDETTVVRRIRKGDPRVYDLLIEEYGRLLWTIVAGILVGNGTQEDVEEVVSDVFIALWQKPQAYDPARSSLRAYLCVMAKSRALDRLRRLCRAPVVSLDTEQEPAGQMRWNNCWQGRPPLRYCGCCGHLQSQIGRF